MDALELLKTDHRKVADLFEEAQTSDSVKRQRTIFNTIKSELELHSYIEETVFYPVCRKFGEVTSLIDEFQKEHSELKQELESISQLPESSQDIGQRLMNLRDTVKHHVDEEENQLFPQLRKLMRSQEREQLGRHLDAAKQEKSEAA